MKLLFALSATIIFYSACSNQPEKNIKGEWDAHLSYEGKSYVLVGRFKENGTYDAFIDEKLVVSGRYRTNGDTIFFRDGNCDMAYEGQYKMNYYKDSIRMDLLLDSCRERVQGTTIDGTTGVGMKKIK